MMIEKTFTFVRKQCVICSTGFSEDERGYGKRVQVTGKGLKNLTCFATLHLDYLSCKEDDSSCTRKVLVRERRQRDFTDSERRQCSEKPLQQSHPMTRCKKKKIQTKLLLQPFSLRMLYPWMWTYRLVQTCFLMVLITPSCTLEVRFDL